MRNHRAWFALIREDFRRPTAGSARCRRTLLRCLSRDVNSGLLRAGSRESRLVLGAIPGARLAVNEVASWIDDKELIL